MYAFYNCSVELRSFIFLQITKRFNFKKIQNGFYVQTQSSDTCIHLIRSSYKLYIWYKMLSLTLDDGVFVCYYHIVFIHFTTACRKDKPFNLQLSLNKIFQHVSNVNPNTYIRVSRCFYFRDTKKKHENHYNRVQAHETGVSIYIIYLFIRKVQGAVHKWRHVFFWFLDTPSPTYHTASHPKSQILRHILMTHPPLTEKIFDLNFLHFDYTTQIIIMLSCCLWSTSIMSIKPIENICSWSSLKNVIFSRW